MDARVTAVSRSSGHTFSKMEEPQIRLIAGLGVEGDAHAGAMVQHRSRLARDAAQPNLRQVHLVADELFEALRADGYAITPGAIGENVTTYGIDLLALPRGALLHLGVTAIVEVTGLRNPCKQLDAYAKGLMAALLDRDDDGNLVRKGGVMAIVREGGEVRPGDPIRVVLPPGPPLPLQPV